jgi:Zn-dependent peptidase ImmA (M78 family)
VHELAHVLLAHNPTRIDVAADQQLLLRTHDPQQEDEAAWLAGCLLLPRPALLLIARDAGVRAHAARRYGVSVEMLTYRLRVTGVEVQARRGTRWGSRRAGYTTRSSPRHPQGSTRRRRSRSTPGRFRTCRASLRTRSRSATAQMLRRGSSSWMALSWPGSARDIANGAISARP